MCFGVRRQGISTLECQLNLGTSITGSWLVQTIVWLCNLPGTADDVFSLPLASGALVTRETNGGCGMAQAGGESGDVPGRCCSPFALWG